MEDSNEAITTTMVVIEDAVITLAEEATMETAAIIIARRARSCRMMENGRRRHRIKMQASRADRALLKLINMQFKDQRKPTRAVTQAAPTMYFQNNNVYSGAQGESGTTTSAGNAAAVGDGRA